jgi:subtilase family protein
MFHPSWDFPVGHPGNYSDNPLHPFNVIVGTLEALGADILFAAGNCGSNCPDGRCQGVTSNAIYGANGHDKVLCVAGVDTSKQRVGYSTRGPGRLTRNKPDLCGYTHFAGSGVYAADGGTSAATPVVAGVVAAYRTKRPFEPGNPSVSPGAVRNLMRSSCQDLGAAGYDFDHGYGVINGCAIADNLRLRQPPLDICRIIPRLCQPFPVPIDICQRYPQLCSPRPGPLPGSLSGPRPSLDSGTEGVMDLGANAEGLESLSREEMMELVYRLGYQQALEGSSAGSPSPAPAGGGGGGAKAKCGCGGD